MSWVDEIDDWIWWCTKCDREVAAGFVRYDETHDGCGAPVNWIPEQTHQQ